MQILHHALYLYIWKKLLRSEKYLSLVHIQYLFSIHSSSFLTSLAIFQNSNAQSNFEYFSSSLSLHSIANWPRFLSFTFLFLNSPHLLLLLKKSPSPSHPLLLLFVNSTRWFFVPLFLLKRDWMLLTISSISVSCFSFSVLFLETDDSKQYLIQLFKETTNDIPIHRYLFNHMSDYYPDDVKNMLLEKIILLQSLFSYYFIPSDRFNLVLLVSPFIGFWLT